MRIYGQPVYSDSPHIRLVNAVWNSGTHPLQRQITAGNWGSAICGIVLVYDTITREYKALWGTISHYNPTGDESDHILEHARHIAAWGQGFPLSAAQVLFGDLSRPPDFDVKEAA